MSDATPDAARIARWRDLREEIRRAERLPGQCHLVTDVIAVETGWERRCGTYLDPTGTLPAGDGAHFWLMTSDGTLVDPTADQLGENEDDVRVLAPDDPRHRRYAFEWSGDWNPTTRGYAPLAHQHERDPALWTGEDDADACERIRLERGGDRWWYVVGDRRHVDEYLRKCAAYRKGGSKA